MPRNAVQETWMDCEPLKTPDLPVPLVGIHNDLDTRMPGGPAAN
jgi:hypothetical protein